MNQVCHYLNDALMFRIHDNRLQGGFTDQLNSFTLNMPSSSLNKSIIVFYTAENKRFLQEKQAFPLRETRVSMRGNCRSPQRKRI